MKSAQHLDLLSCLSLMRLRLIELRSRGFDIENVEGILYGVYISTHLDRIDTIKRKNINIVKCVDRTDCFNGKPAQCIVFTASKEIFHEIHREYSNGNVH